MQIDAEHKQQIEKIIKSIECQKNFECYKSNFTRLCKAKDIGMETFVECLSEENRTCNFVLPFGNKYLCRCPLRLYISKRLKK
jgi:hypothetical protein